jgi:outer membrane lipopolysaccharide assembly protein LptE/RlpB
MMARGLIGLVLMLSLLGCGYHLQGKGDTLPAGVRYVHVAILHNATYEPFLENAVTGALLDRLIRSPGVELVNDPDQADAFLTGTVTQYASNSLSYDGRDRIAEYRSRMTVEVALRHADNAQVLWKGRSSWTEDYIASADKALEDDREKAAIGEIARRLADDIYSRMVDDF